jgi:hypothetical protein
LGIVRIRPQSDGEDRLREALREKLDPAASDGIISMHLIESDTMLSKPLTDSASATNPGAGDWFVLIDATSVIPIPAALARLNGASLQGGTVVSAGSYVLMWDLARSDIGSP